jgi:RNase P subunit RPR2
MRLGDADMQIGWHSAAGAQRRVCLSLHTALLQDLTSRGKITNASHSFLKSRNGVLPMPWRVFCKHCRLPFEVDKASITDETGGRGKELALKCPHCGTTAKYIAQDVSATFPGK